MNPWRTVDAHNGALESLWSEIYITLIKKQDPDPDLHQSEKSDPDTHKKRWL